MPITVNISQQGNGIKFQGSGTLNPQSFQGKISSIKNGSPKLVFNAGTGFVDFSLPTQSPRYFQG